MFSRDNMRNKWSYGVIEFAHFKSDDEVDGQWSGQSIIDRLSIFVISRANMRDKWSYGVFGVADHESDVQIDRI